MMFAFYDCTNCVHNDICNKKAEYERLKEKIQNVDKSKTYDGFAVRVECTYRRLDSNIASMNGGIEIVTRA